MSTHRGGAKEERTTMLSVKEKTIETDLLVIGGGLAGAFAAIKARGAGCERVMVVSKGRLGKDSISSFDAQAKRWENRTLDGGDPC